MHAELLFVPDSQTSRSGDPRIDLGFQHLCSAAGPPAANREKVGSVEQAFGIDAFGIDRIYCQAT